MHHRGSGAAATSTERVRESRRVPGCGGCNFIRDSAACNERPLLPSP